MAPEQFLLYPGRHAAQMVEAALPYGHAAFRPWLPLGRGGILWVNAPRLLMLANHRLAGHGGMMGVEIDESHGTGS